MFIFLLSSSSHSLPFLFFLLSPSLPLSSLLSLQSSTPSTTQMMMCLLVDPMAVARPSALSLPFYACSLQHQTPDVCLSLPSRPSLNRSAFLSACLSVRLSAFLPVCPSVCFCVSVSFVYLCLFVSVSTLPGSCVIGVLIRSV